MNHFILAAITVIGVITAAVFITALLQAEDGYEDETGFHQVSPSPGHNRGGARTPFDSILISSPGEGI
jgi:hypothetical protein